MAGSVLSFTGVSKSYGSVKAVDDLSFAVEGQSVTGLLGPNGAGKSTVMKLCLGLARAKEGDIELFGARPRTRAFRPAVRRTGSQIELPALYERASARRNLEIHGAGFGIRRRDPWIDQVLDMVGLSGRSDDRVKGYSMGMRQRLSLGLALLNRPEFVILDEPVNGLDPAGVVEVRELIRSLPSGGVTVLVSSHLLDEIERTVDRVVIIRDGRLVTEGAIGEIVSSGYTLVQVARREARDAVDVLTASGMGATAGERGQVRVDTGGRPASEVAKALADAGIYPTELRAEHNDLESAFLGLVDDGSGDAQG
ncbi:MAG: ATP-binding cassette domain-containing protein [Solirubrobacterales bacterium]